MIKTLGKTLIQNHELDMFNTFFFSQNCLYMDDEIITELLGCALQYYVPEFLVPIYALCDSNYKLLRKPLRSGPPQLEPKCFQTFDSNL